MNTFEKIFSIFALFFTTGMIVMLSLIPETRTFSFLIPLALGGVTINAGLLFIVFKDIFFRTFPSESSKYLWAILIFFFLPAILVYLPKHGFKPR